jgi:hypothetical protein
MTSSLGPRAFQLKHSPPAREAARPSARARERKPCRCLAPEALYFFFAFFACAVLSWVTSRPRSTFSPSSLN